MMKSVLITGVLGGIGKSLAKSFKNAGYFVYGLDIRDMDHELQICDKFYKFDINEFAKGGDYFQQWTGTFYQDIPKLV
jgi:nucleoside-diphosphate-sugar epimerase